MLVHIIFQIQNNFLSQRSRTVRYESHLKLPSHLSTITYYLYLQTSCISTCLGPPDIPLKYLTIRNSVFLPWSFPVNRSCLPLLLIHYSHRGSIMPACSQLSFLQSSKCTGPSATALQLSSLFFSLSNMWDMPSDEMLSGSPRKC